MVSQIVNVHPLVTINWFSGNAFLSKRHEGRGVSVDIVILLLFDVDTLHMLLLGRSHHSAPVQTNHMQFADTSVQFMSDSLWPHGMQHARLPCPSPTPGACSNSCPSSWWCHPTISSSARHLKSFKFCHEKSCDSPLLPFFASADHLLTHPCKISLILSDLSHVLIGQNCFCLCLQLPSHTVSPPDSRHQHCWRGAFSITTVTRQAFDWKCGTGRGRGEPAECTWRLPSILMGEAPGTLGPPAASEMDPVCDTAFVLRPHLPVSPSWPQAGSPPVPGYNSDSFCLQHPPNLRVQCVYQEPVFPSDLQ